jgi:hypothetical protein
MRHFVLKSSPLCDFPKPTVTTNGSTLPIGRRSPIGEAAAPTEANRERHAATIACNLKKHDTGAQSKAQSSQKQTVQGGGKRVPAMDHLRREQCLSLIKDAMKRFSPHCAGENGWMTESDAWFLASAIIEPIRKAGLLTNEEHFLSDFPFAVMRAWGRIQENLSLEDRAGTILEWFICQTNQAVDD